MPSGGNPARLEPATQVKNTRAQVVDELYVVASAAAIGRETLSGRHTPLRSGLAGVSDVPSLHPRSEDPLNSLLDDLRSRLAPQYRIERELGGGGMSRVFLAEETGLSRRVVLKVPRSEFAAVLSAERFQREVRLAAGLQHPHIVPLLTAGHADPELQPRVHEAKGRLADLLAEPRR